MKPILTIAATALAGVVVLQIVAIGRRRSAEREHERRRLILELEERQGKRESAAIKMSGISSLVRGVSSFFLPLP